MLTHDESVTAIDDLVSLANKVAVAAAASPHKGSQRSPTCDSGEGRTAARAVLPAYPPSTYAARLADVKRRYDRRMPFA